MKKLILSLLSAALVIGSANAQLAVTAQLPANTGSNIILGPLTSVRFTLLSTNIALNSTVSIYDSPGTSQYYVLAPFTNYAQNVYLVTNIWTNYMGALNTNVFKSLTNVASVTAQTTNLYPLIAVINVSSNTAPGTGNATYNFAYPFRFGMFVSNSAAVTFSTIVTK